MKITGTVVKLGDYIDTDTIIPGRHLHRTDKQWLLQHIFEDKPETRRKLLQTKPPIIIVAGEALGMGSSREHAILALKAAGVKAIIAKSFNRIFYRNAIANAIPPIEADIQDKVKDGDTITIDLEKGTITINNTKTIKTKPYPPTIMKLIKTGGIKQLLKQTKHKNPA